MAENSTTRVGFASKDATTTTLEDGKKVANVWIITGQGDKKKTTYIRGWAGMSDVVGNVKKGEKWEFRGQLKDEPGKDGKSYPTLTAKEAYQHVKLNIQNAVIRDISHKTVKGTDVPMTNIMIVKSSVEDNKQVDNVYNIGLYGKNVSKAEGYVKGQTISINDYARHYPYEGQDGKKKLNIEFQNPLKITNHTLEAKQSIDESKAKETTKDKSKATTTEKSTKNKKSKGASIGM